MTRHAPSPPSLALAAAAVAAAPASAHHGPPPPAQPTLLARAILPADATGAGPVPRRARHRAGPAPGSVQPVGGFSALLERARPRPLLGDARQRLRHQGQLASFLLRVYEVHADFETARGGAGDGRRSSSGSRCATPTTEIPFKIVNDATPRPAAHRRRLRHRVLARGLPRRPLVRRRVRALPGAHRRDAARCSRRRSRCPTSSRPTTRRLPPPGGPPNLAGSNGFEGMAISPDGRTLYPTLEGPVTGDDPLTRAHVPVRHPQPPLRRHAPDLPPRRPDLPRSRTSPRSDDHHFVALERDDTRAPRPSTSRPSRSTCARPTPPARWPSARSSTSSTCATRR